MRKTVIYTSLVGSLLIFLETSNLFGAIVMFCLFGVVPGIQQPLTANQMLVFYLLVASSCIVVFARDWLKDLRDALRASRRVS